MDPFGHQDPTLFIFLFLRRMILMMSIENLYIKVNFLRTCQLIQLNKKSSFKRQPRISETTRPIKQNVNVSRTETVNQATKYLRDYKKYLLHTLDGHI